MSFEHELPTELRAYLTVSGASSDRVKAVAQVWAEMALAGFLLTEFMRRAHPEQPEPRGVTLHQILRICEVLNPAWVINDDAE